MEDRSSYTKSIIGGNRGPRQYIPEDPTRSSKLNQRSTREIATAYQRRGRRQYIPEEQPQPISYRDSGFNNFLTRGLPEPEVRTEDEVRLHTPQISAANLFGNLSNTQIEDAINDIIRISGTTTAASGAVADGSGVKVTTTLSDRDLKTRIMLGICESDAWQDSIADNNQIPYGSDAIASGHRVYTNHDLNRNLISTTPSTGITFVHNVQNETGAPHQYWFRIRWRYIGNPAS